MSYEAGVVWIPGLVSGENTFSVVEFNKRQSGSEKFPVHYDLPVTKYGDRDKPWLMDALR